MPFPVSQEWKLCRRIECDDRSLTWGPRDRLQARLWLEQLERSAMAMSALRLWLASQNDGWDISRMSDQALIEQIAALISRGFAHVHVLAAPREPSPLMPRRSPPEAPVEAAPRSRPREVAPVAETETSTFHDVDPAAQAATLTAAAASGTPFCPT